MGGKEHVDFSQLSSNFALLHKIALSNLMPSRQIGYVKWTLAILLYNIEDGIRFNVGQLIYDQIVNTKNGTEGK